MDRGVDLNIKKYVSMNYTSIETALLYISFIVLNCCYLYLFTNDIELFNCANINDFLNNDFSLHTLYQRCVHKYVSYFIYINTYQDRRMNYFILKYVLLCKNA
jgi:hypothetical protein